MKKVLITGATGFIGSFLVEEALSKGYDVYAGIRKTSNRHYLHHLKVQFIELDFSDPEKLQSPLAQLRQRDIRFDYIIHNAGITREKKNETFRAINFINTKNLIDALIASDMIPEKFILISSLASFGPGRQDFVPIKLTDVKAPISEYGRSKLEAEVYLQSLANFPYLIINPTGVYGPRDKDFLELVKLINKGFEPCLGKNRQMISLIYVKDLARAVVDLIASTQVNRSFIISDGCDYSKEQMAEMAKTILDKNTIKIKLPLKPILFAMNVAEKVHKIFKGYPPFLSKEKIREISHANWLCNSNDTWEAIQSKPNYDLQRGLLETIQWYRENKWI